MIWAMMQHLGYNMWHDEAIWRGPGRMKWSNFCRDTMMCQDVSWKLRMKRLLEPGSGTNTLVIDVGEGVVYPSHPEIAIKGSWSAEKLNKEVKRRSKVIGVFPNPASAIRLMGSFLMEENDRWAAMHKVYYSPACKKLESRAPALVAIAHEQRRLRLAA